MLTKINCEEIMKKKIFKLIILCFMILLVSCAKNDTLKNATSSNASNEPYTYVFEIFDTTSTLALYGVKEKRIADNFANSCKQFLDEMENKLSKTKEGSDIYNINHRTSDTVMVSEWTADLMELGAEFYLWSNNHFDISSGTLIDLWDIKNRTTLPSLKEINEARMHCGNFSYTIERDVEENADRPNRMTFSGDKQTQYDLGALVKGYAADKVREILQNQDIIKACILNLGGNVMCYGEMEGRKKGTFNIGILQPFTANELIEKVEVSGAKNVITSGNYQRYFKIDGDDTIYHHIIDPQTGYPSDNGYNSVTIISENGAVGDYLSTTGMLNDAEGMKWLIDFFSKSFGDKNIQAIYVDKNNQITRYPQKVKLY